MMNLLRSFAVLLGVVGLISATVPAQPVYAAASCERSLLGIPPWYKGLTTGSDCSIQKPTNLQTFIAKIALNIVNILLVLVIYIASGFIIYGAFYYLASGGNANRISKAKGLILNAVIGLILAAASAPIVGFVAGQL